jgi:16S rRNA (guanine527-N7)-methyltransferase
VEKALAELAPEFSDAQKIAALSAWLELIVDWNQRVDLTAARNDDELVDLCLADAAVVARHARGSGSENWVDIGTGLGAPGLALAVLAPQLRVKLVEPKAKRVAFVRTACGALKLPNVTVQRARSDELESQSFDVAISRATLPPDEWLIEGARLARQRVWVLLAKGEIPEAPGWEVSEDVSYRWPLTNVERRLIQFRPSAR